VIWSNPGDGSGVWSIVPAVPSATGVADVFAFQADGTVQAIRSDGTTAWTANASPGESMPDFQGGLVVSSVDPNTGLSTITKLDGITGQANSTYTVTPPSSGTPGSTLSFAQAVHTDGTIFAVKTNTDSNGNPLTTSIIGIDLLLSRL
jgi:hypothetical protein